jgi:hypothetical protein
MLRGGTGKQVPTLRGCEMDRYDPVVVLDGSGHDMVACSRCGGQEPIDGGIPLMPQIRAFWEHHLACHMRHLHAVVDDVD